MAKVFGKQIWTTSDGRELEVTEMENDHLVNLHSYLVERVTEMGNMRAISLDADQAKKVMWREITSMEIRERRIRGEMSYDELVGQKGIPDVAGVEELIAEALKTIREEIHEDRARNAPPWTLNAMDVNDAVVIFDIMRTMRKRGSPYRHQAYVLAQSIKHEAEKAFEECRKCAKFDSCPTRIFLYNILTYPLNVVNIDRWIDVFESATKVLKQTITNGCEPEASDGTDSVKLAEALVRAHRRQRAGKDIDNPFLWIIEGMFPDGD